MLTGDVVPVKQRAYPANPFKRELIDEHIKLIRENNIIEVCHSPWASPVVMAKKKTGEGNTA